MPYNAAMPSRVHLARLAVGLALALLVSGCNRLVENDLKLVDVKTGWYDAGLVNGQNKIVPNVTLKLQNVSSEAISRVQLLAVFRRVGEDKDWGPGVFVVAIDGNGLDAGKTGGQLVLRSTIGYTGPQSRAQMLRNREFVDAKVNVFAKHGSRTWIKMGEFTIERNLLAPVAAPSE
jgi:hypothetical protein